MVFVVLLACVGILMRELMNGRCAPRLSPSCHPQLFERTIRQFNILYAKKAYISNFQTQPMFKDGLEEFDDALYVVGAVNSLPSSPAYLRLDSHSPLQEHAISHALRNVAVGNLSRPQRNSFFEYVCIQTPLKSLG